MPAVGAWLVATWNSVGIGATILKTAASLALNFAVAKLTAPKGPDAQELQNEIRQSNAPRIRHLGRVKASGTVMFWDWAQVGDARVLFKLVAVGQGGITAVEKWWLNDKQVDVSGVNVTSEPFEGVVKLRARTGRGVEISGGAHASLQSAFPGQWTATHRLHQVGTIMGEFEAVSGEDIARVYSGGEPSISAVIRGDACFNPFDGSYAWTDNLVVQLRDVMTHPDYGVLTAADLDQPSFAAAINDAAEQIPLRGGGTTKRYYGGCSYALSSPMKDVATRLLAGFAGRIFITTEGKIGVRSGKWRAPKFTITEDKIVALDIGPGSGEFERVTTLIPSYVSPEIGWQSTTADQWDDNAAIALYGESVPKTLELDVVQHHGQARRLAKIQLAKLNPAWRATVRLRFWGLLLLEEENVYIDLSEFGLGIAPAWIDSFSFDMDSADGVCTVSLIAADPESFQWNPQAEEGDPPKQPESIDHSETLISAPVAESVQVITDDGAPYILVKTNPPPSAVYLEAVYYREGASNRYVMSEGVDTATGGKVVRSGGLEDRGQYAVTLTWVNSRANSISDAVGSRAASETLVISGIEVFENSTPPAAPVVVSTSGAAGGSYSVTFEPDLGVNYKSTELWRGAVGSSFSAATLIKSSFSTSSQVTMTSTVPAGGARFWIISVNPSGVKSAPVTAGSFT